MKIAIGSAIANVNGSSKNNPTPKTSARAVVDVVGRRAHHTSGSRGTTPTKGPRNGARDSAKAVPSPSHTSEVEGRDI